MNSPETTPLHELVEALPTALANGLTAVALLVLLVGLTLFVARAFREARAEEARRRSRTHTRALRQMHRGDEAHAPRRFDR